MNQMQMNMKAAPYKVETDVPDRTYEVQENGDVIMTEKVNSKIYFHGREFISFIRGFEAELEEFQKRISEEEINKTKEDIEKTKIEVDKIKPYQDIVEQKLNEVYEKQKEEMKIQKFDRTKNLFEEILDAAEEDQEKILPQLKRFLSGIEKEEKVKLIESLSEKHLAIYSKLAVDNA